MGNIKEAAPDSEEQKFKVKCQELRRRISEVEESNELSSLALSRTRMSIRRLRLEYSVLLERLESQVVRFLEDGRVPAHEAMARPYKPVLVDENLNFKAVKGKPGKERRGKNGTMSAAALRKAARDPNLPKRPTNAYLMFCDREKDKVRARLEKNNLGKPVTEVMRVLTEMWKALDDKLKIPYLKLYEEDRERYHREMIVYNNRKHDDALTRGKPPTKIKLGVAHLEPDIQEEPEPPGRAEVEAEDEMEDMEREDMFFGDDEDMEEDADETEGLDESLVVAGDENLPVAS